MGKFKFNKKHLFSFFISLVLIFSLNISAFAGSSLVSFYDFDFIAFYQSGDSAPVDCTSSTSKIYVKTSTADNGRYYTRFLFSSGARADKSLISYIDLDLYTNSEYDFDFQFLLNNSTCPTDVSISLLVTSQNDEYELISIYETNDIYTEDWVDVNGSFKTPDFSGSVEYCLLVQFREDVNTSGTSGQAFYISDLKCTPSGPLYGEEIMTPDTGGLSDDLKNYDDLIGSLPTIDGGEINDLMNFDFGSFADGMNFVRDMFDRTLMTFNFSSVILFALVFGLACLILGRKAGN